MHKSSHSAELVDLDQLRAAYPEYDFERDPRRDPVRYSAVARDLGAGLHSIVTADLDELGRELAGSRQRCGAAAQGAPALGKTADEIVMRLEADWPGWQIWTVHHAIGRRVTWCARRQDWRPGQAVLNTDTPEHLIGCLEDETNRQPGTG